MNDREIYYQIIIPLKKFYVIDYTINYLIDLDTAQRYIEEPYIQPILEDLYYIYENNTATTEEMLKPYIDELLLKMENAENDYARITTDDYQYLKYVYQVLKTYDLDFACFLSEQQITYNQSTAIINHHERLSDDEFIPEVRE